MDKCTQFKINSVSDIEKHYERYGKYFNNSLEQEINDYNQGMNYMYCTESYIMQTDTGNLDYTTIDNPYSEAERVGTKYNLSEALNDVIIAAEELNLKVEINLKPKNK